MKLRLEHTGDATVAILALVAACSGTVCANSLSITNVTVKSINGTNAHLIFDISWENSWRHRSGGDPLHFHDAAWVFFKVCPSGGAGWEHVQLEGSGTNPVNYSTGTGTPVEIVVPEDRVGLFIRRSSDRAGTTRVQNVKAVWNLSSSSPVEMEQVKVRAFGVEMVYVAKGKFSVGDGTGSTIQGQLETGTSGTPFQITNEAYAIKLGGGGAGSLGNNNATGMAAIADDFNDSTARTLPAEFPKGYAAFYCMKYEITQGQYADFLNALTRDQQTNRCTATTLNNYMSAAEGGSPTIQNRNTVRLTADSGSPASRVYTTVTPDRACNFLSWSDVAAFADWAGLRPMTELEFEKACRGPLAPVADEYAWGTSTIMGSAKTLSGPEDGTETVTNSAVLGGCHYGNVTISGGDGGQGPLRAGIFATNNTDRVSAGVSYCGVMELSGNMLERAVTIGNAAGRSFTGLHGNGALTADGGADVAAWPGSSATGVGLRGGSWYYVASFARVSSRNIAAYVRAARDFCYGGRAVRTACLPRGRMTGQ